MIRNLELQDAIHMPDAPAIEGLTFRIFRGESDYPHMAAIDNAFCAAHGMEFVTSVEEIANDLSHPEGFDPHCDILFAEVNGEPVAYARTDRHVNDDDEQIFNHGGSIRPEWLRKGIGRAMMHWCEARARENATEHPHTGPRFLQTWAFDTMPGKIALAEQEGYRPVRYGFQMVRPLAEQIPHLPLPEGIEVRLKLPQHYRAIWEAGNEAFRDHWGHRERTESDWQEFLNWPDHQPELCQVAWDKRTNTVAGEVTVTIYARDNAAFGFKRGYTDPIFVRRPYRKQGLAKALIARALCVLKDEGMDEAALFVDAQNPSGALKLYENMGYRVHRETFTYRKAL
jgi:mycothiol synthase